MGDDLVLELDQVGDSQAHSQTMKGVCLRSVTDNLNSGRQALGGEQRDRVKNQVEAFVGDQSTHADDVGGRGRLDVRHGIEVNSVRGDHHVGVGTGHDTQPLRSLRGRGQDRVGQPHRPSLEPPGHPAGPADVGRPPSRIPHLVPGDHEASAAQPSHQPEGEQLEVGHVVCLQDVEAGDDETQTGQGKAHRLEGRAPAVPVQGDQRRDAVIGHPIAGDPAGPPPPPHRVYVDIHVLGQARRDLHVALLLPSSVVRRDRVRDQGDNRPAGRQAPAA